MTPDVFVFTALLQAMAPSSPGAQPVDHYEAQRRAKAVVASDLDPALAAVSLEEWMKDLVGDGGSVRWNRTACQGTHGSGDRTDPVCVWVRGETPGKRVATVSIWLGVGAANRESWGKPRFDEAFLEFGNESVTVERLPDLPGALRLPPGDWPKPDLRITPRDISCELGNRLPGTPVQCNVTIHNDGDASARGILYFAIIRADLDYGGANTRWEGDVRAKGKTVVSLRLVWPEGKVGAISAFTEVLTAPGRHTIRERDNQNNRAYLKVTSDALLPVR